MRTATMLREARRRAGLSQRSLAARAGVPQSTVGRIEAGAIDPRTGTLLRLLEACGAQVEVVRRMGDGVDRSQIRARLALTPRQRLAEAAAAAAAVGSLQGRARRLRR